MASLSVGGKLLLLAGNALPLLHCAGLGVMVWWLHEMAWVCVGVVVAALYLLPPLLCRVIAMVLPIRRERIDIGSRDFFSWWFSLNLQILFSRFPVLEEVLRIVPGCYSMWLRLWGSRIGKLTYWAAGLRILDRQWLDIGDNVTFGADVRINPHVMLPDEHGRMMLMLAPVKIADRVSVGGYSLLVAGTVIAEDQCTRAFLILPPFCRLEKGRRHKPDEET